MPLAPAGNLQKLRPSTSPAPQTAPPQKNYTSRDPKQLRADGRAQTCQQLVAFCASTRMNQNDAVVNLARVALLHVCCWRGSRFSTAPELRLGKRAGERARVNASVAAQARSHVGSSNTHVQFRHTCVYTWNTHTYTTETVYIHLRHTHKCVELENKHMLLGKHTHTCVHLEHTYVFTYDTLMCSRETHTHVCTRGTHMRSPGTQRRAIKLKHTYVYAWDTHMYTTGTQTCVHLEHRVCD